MDTPACLVWQTVNDEETKTAAEEGKIEGKCPECEDDEVRCLQHPGSVIAYFTLSVPVLLLNKKCLLRRYQREGKT